MTKKMRQGGVVSCLVVGNYCHDVLIKDGEVLAESLGGAASFIAEVLDGLSVAATFISKVGSDFSYAVNHPPIVSAYSRTTLFHAHFSSQIQRQDRVLKRVRFCEPITPLDLPDSRFEYGLAVGVGGEVLPETLERMLDICETVFVDVQGLIRAFDEVDGTVRLVQLKDSKFYNLLPRIGFLKASADEAPYIDVDEAKKFCCLVVTNGKDGCTLYYRDDEQQIAPFPTVQVDPTGAGDSFLGGFVAGLALGLAAPDAALLGNFFGSLTVGQMGLPKFDSGLLQRVKEEVQRKRLRLFECHEPGKDSSVVFMKPLDHEDFLTALSTAKSLLTCPNQKTQVGLATLPKVVEHYNHLPSGQSKQFPGFVFDEPIWSGDEVP
ncbi:inositol 3-kinase [Primulina huaijiensis]|uniref:inositol 3-kinase n=1 Tax=Primulina huaijiensis TaxID=1492673 RepID=UPI003CC76623